MSWKKAKAALFWVHRWLGIGTCLLFAMWFATGIIMMYVEYPELTETERLENLPALTIEPNLLPPLQAAQAIDADSVFTAVRLTSVFGRPSYRFTAPDRADYYVFADTGELLSTVNEVQAMAAVESSGFYSALWEPSHSGLIDLDQWTLSASLDKHRPLHRINLNDDAGSVLYVSSRSGQVVRDTHRSERFWNWLGSTLHWIYPAVLRQNASLWNDVIVYVSLLGIFSVVSGTIIGVMRIRIRNPYRGRDISPYQGWMKWHHIMGLATLVFVSTFIFSGLMSMGPWGVFSSSVSAQEQVNRFKGDLTLRLSKLAIPLLESDELPIKEIHWHQIQSQPYATVVNSAAEKSIAPGPGRDLHWLSNTIKNTIPALIPAAQLLSVELITNEDDYYYSRHNRYRPFPVYRAKFNDSDDSWFHIDATNGEVLNRVDNASRRERWLYNSLHSLDFQILWQARPLWDIVVILLSLIGFGFSVTSVVIGWRKLAS